MDQILGWRFNQEKNGEAEFCTHARTCMHKHAQTCQHLQYLQQEDQKSIILVFVFRAQCSGYIVKF